MELKKSQKADLENKKNTFFLFGLIISLGLTLLAFEWPGGTNRIEVLSRDRVPIVEEEFVPITRELEVKSPLPPPPPTTVEVINIVDNNKDIIEELKIDDTGADENTFIDIPTIFIPKEKPVDDKKIFINAIEEPAEFPGGDMALFKFINSNVNYPRIAQENGVEGKVIIRFVVDEEGNASNAEVIRSVDANLDKEALRVINMLPKFKPGKQGGKAVKVYFVSTINFKLE